MSLINKLTYLAAAVIEKNKDSNSQNVVKIKNSNVRDVVTELDIAINEALIDYVLKENNEFIIFSEEKYVNNFDKENFKNFTVVIDPLDGTHNYQLGMPYYCVLIAIVNDRRVISSSIVSPTTKDIVIWEDNKIKASNGFKSLFNRAPSYFAYPPKLLEDNPELAIDIFKIIDKGSSGLYRWGSAGTGLLGLIKGELQSFIGIEVRLWDVLAALPILRQMGCHVEYKLFNDETISVVASWDAQHYELLSNLVFKGGNSNRVGDIEVANYE